MSSSNNDFLFEIEPIADLEDGKKYHILVEVPMTSWYDDVYFRTQNGIAKKLNHKENRDGKVYFEGEIDLPTRAIYNYYFTYFADGYPRIHKKEEKVNNIISYRSFKMSVNYDVPRWAEGEMMYHIFVDRFFRGNEEEMKKMPRRVIHKSWDEEMIIGPDDDGIWNNDFYGGDLKGIEEKSDYIKSLGCNILYLSPIVWSQSNHRYDTADYENVDPYLGCNDDLKSLCDAAHQRGMKVVLDGVFNHTGNDSKYFNEYGTFDSEGAFNNLGSKYSKFYRKQVGSDGKICYDYWWGMKNLPVCDGYSKEWQDYIVGVGGVIDKWFDLGIDGLRLDVADELTDDFIEKIRVAVKRNKKDGFILGEVWKLVTRMNRGYVVDGKGMDSAMNYPLVDALMRYFKYSDIGKLVDTIEIIKDEYPEGTINTLMNFTSTHDISRPITTYGAPDEFSEYSEWCWNPNDGSVEHCKNFKLTKEQYEKGKEIYQAHVSALAFMPGILSIFYGDEAGVEGLGNLANRRPYPWGKEDKGLVDFFRSIGNLRVNEEFLKRADINLLKINHDYLMFERVGDNDKALITINRTDKEMDFDVPDEYQDGQKIYSLKKSYNGHLGPYGAVAIKKKR